MGVYLLLDGYNGIEVGLAVSFTNKGHYRANGRVGGVNGMAPVQGIKLKNKSFL